MQAVILTEFGPPYVLTASRKYYYRTMSNASPITVEFYLAEGGRRLLSIALTGQVMSDWSCKSRDAFFNKHSPQAKEAWNGAQP